MAAQGLSIGVIAIGVIAKNDGRRG